MLFSFCYSLYNTSFPVSVLKKPILLDTIRGVLEGSREHLVMNMICSNMPSNLPDSCYSLYNTNFPVSVKKELILLDTIAGVLEGSREHPVMNMIYRNMPRNFPDSCLHSI
jgi:hypothetical protein